MFQKNLKWEEALQQGYLLSSCFLPLLDWEVNYFILLYALLPRLFLYSDNVSTHSHLVGFEPCTLLHWPKSVPQCSCLLPKFHIREGLHM